MRIKRNMVSTEKHCLQPDLDILEKNVRSLAADIGKERSEHSFAVAAEMDAANTELHEEKVAKRSLFKAGKQR